MDNNVSLMVKEAVEKIKKGDDKKKVFKEVEVKLIKLQDKYYKQATELDAGKDCVQFGAPSKEPLFALAELAKICGVKGEKYEL